MTVFECLVQEIEELASWSDKDRRNSRLSAVIDVAENLKRHGHITPQGYALLREAAVLSANA